MSTLPTFLPFGTFRFPTRLWCPLSCEITFLPLFITFFFFFWDMSIFLDLYSKEFKHQFSFASAVLLRNCISLNINNK